MNYKTLTATLLLSCLPLLSQPLLAADKPDAKPATTVTAAKESGKVNLNTASINELTALKGSARKGPGHRRLPREAGQVHYRGSAGRCERHRASHAGSKSGHDYRQVTDPYPSHHKGSLWLPYFLRVSWAHFVSFGTYL